MSKPIQPLSSCCRRGFARSAIALLLVAMLPPAAFAFGAGERHLVAEQPTARERDAEHGTDLRITVWYPAADGAAEAPLAIGPPGQPLFVAGTSAQDAPFADDTRRAIVLLSHGFGGSARVMAWFGTALARAGYVVVAPDHPGNNAIDPITMAGATYFWQRPGDLAVALARVRRDPAIGPHLDASRIGAAGFSAGGFTALAIAGGRVSVPHLDAFCAAHPRDGVCMPQKEFAPDPAALAAFRAQEQTQRAVAASTRNLAIPGIKAVFAMAPAIVQGFAPDSLRAIGVPVRIVAGDADVVAPPATNARVAAEALPHARLTMLPGVAHYDFLAECTPDGEARIELCRSTMARRATHDAAIREAIDLFDATLASAKAAK